MAQTSSSPFTVQIAAAPPPLAASLRLTSTLAGTNLLPFTIGYAFQKGAFTSGTTLALDQGATSQVLVKRQWNDGSVKHAVISGHATLTANIAMDLQIAAGTSSAGTALTSTDILNKAPTASVGCGIFGTVTLTSLLPAPFRTWLSGPEMVECHYRAAVGADATLVVWFHVRLYRTGRLWIRAICENGYLDVNTLNKTYVPNVTISGAMVYNNGGASLTHYANTRWDVEGWIGGDPQITPKHNVLQLIATRLVPNYWKRNPSQGVLNGLGQVYSPMASGGWTLDQSNPGFQYEIGIMALWDALYCTSTDPRAYRSVTANARALNSYGIVWRDSADKLPTRPSARPTWSVNGNGAGGSNGVVAGPLNWDMAHHGSAGYLAYLVTGDYYYLETMQHQASTCYLCNDAPRGLGTARILQGQTRAMAWSLRTVGQLAAIGPSGGATDSGTISVTTDYATLLANNMTHWDAERQRAGQNGLGVLYNYELAHGDYAAYGIGHTASWQQNFMVQTIGHLSELEPLSDMTALNGVRDFSYRWPVGLLGTSGPANYCFSQAVSYTVKIADAFTADVTTCYATWGQVFAATFGTPNASCGTVLLGSSGGDPTVASMGYWGNLMPAIAYAVDHGATGAAAAFGRLTGASNWTGVQNCVPPFDDLPNWGIVPRGSLGT
jgi:hypothetical protein